ncbi:cytochrome P450 monooxygenase-like protein [Saccharata proteae CBS 121410]|uniref:Cytochrome P450 monooxygenase-like protein n=1 Tax=Saccharata proteae CBS 121410 TaxID=1314787 RepID=A0A9P4HMY5_9PEZI|nr:cytochrome P450 monooxygenase-like protein [Saccharata proteae CBS 121410]
MPTVFLLAPALLVATYFWNTYRSFAANLAAAKQSQLPYVITPWNGYNVLWMIVGGLIYPLLDKLPVSWTRSWLPFLEPEWVYKRNYGVFEEYGSDAIIVVSPGEIHCYVADAEAVADICARRTDFQKPLERYGNVQLYGHNVVVSEGPTWRRHRKITAPSFSEKNNIIVWGESLRQAQSLLVHWEATKTVANAESDMMSLSLHIISKAGFGIQVLWPHEECSAKEEEVNGHFSSTKPSPGHSMSYKEAMSKLMKNVIWIPIMPKWLRDVVPFEGPRTASLAYDEWGQYMSDLYSMKKADMRNGKMTEGLDLLGRNSLTTGYPPSGAVMRGAGLTQETLNAPKAPEQQLSDSEILGNAFVFMLAGHETTANAMHFALILLALNPRCQRKLQDELKAIFGDRPVQEWTYDRDLPKIMTGYTAAVMYETMRLIPAVTAIPKTTMKDSPQALVVNGKRVVIPENCLTSLDVPGTHHNPKYWPACPDIDALPAGDELDQFKPERWLSNANKEVESDNLDTQSSLFRPAPGVFLPFSEGARSCMGRRFAQVEVMSVLAVLFQHHSVELAVDEFATDDEVERMPRRGSERKEVWQRAAGKSVDLLKNGMASLITLQMRKGHVPLRIVKKGEERFVFD